MNKLFISFCILFSLLVSSIYGTNFRIFNYSQTPLFEVRAEVEEGALKMIAPISSLPRTDDQFGVTLVLFGPNIRYDSDIEIKLTAFNEIGKNIFQKVEGTTAHHVGKLEGKYKYKYLLIKLLILDVIDDKINFEIESYPYGSDGDW